MIFLPVSILLKQINIQWQRLLADFYSMCDCLPVNVIGIQAVGIPSKSGPYHLPGSQQINQQTKNQQE